MSSDLDIYVFKYKELIKETEKAWLVSYGDSEEIWLPKSICSINEEKGILYIPEWLALECEIENYIEEEYY